MGEWDGHEPRWNDATYEGLLSLVLGGCKGGAGKKERIIKWKTNVSTITEVHMQCRVIVGSLRVKMMQIYLGKTVDGWLGEV